MGVNRGRGVAAVTHLLLQETSVRAVLGQMRDQAYLYWI